MGQIIDLSSVRKERQAKQLNKYLQKPNTELKKIDELVANKTLSLEDHQFFLGFLGFLEKEDLDPVHLFHSLIKLSKYQFEMEYSLNWDSVVEFSFIFLAILRKNEPEQYRNFMEQQNGE